MPKAATGSRPHRFDHMAHLITDRVDDPRESGVERYVGLEHLDPESLRIRRWGEVTDVESTKLRFQVGDIIFGKRRVYQRKLAVADFEGICSAHAMVLRARPDVVLPEFLPFFMQSDRFMERALGISVGSLSPTINWNALAREEFVLPPIDEQRRMAALLNALQQAYDTLELLSVAASVVSGAICRASFSSFEGSLVPVSDVATHISKGESPRWQGFDYVEDGVPFITSEHVLLGSLDSDSCKRIPQAFHSKLRRSQIQPGDVLITIVGASIGRGALVPDHIGEANTNQAVALVRFDQTRVLPEYFLQWYLSSKTQQHIASTLVNTARANLSLTDIRSLRMPLPPLDAQQTLVTQMSSLIEARARMTARCRVLDEYRRRVLRSSEATS